ncbi:MAG: molecular chaperone HtpG [Proteobacteria bacterium]|nr:molecular chaperone HtpG [Pseudomonadota bacterium]
MTPESDSPDTGSERDSEPTHEHAFQAETQRLLDLVIHSLYTHKDIFLRELISNASDALDKLRFEGLTRPELLPAGELEIELKLDSESRSLEVADNGVGMTRAEAVENLGTIARSGTRQFLERLGEADAEVSRDLIGQFGVGFYASFMVADEVEVLTRRAGEEGATRWRSRGDGTFQVEDAQRDECGTSVRLKLREPDEEDGLRDYAAEPELRRIVRRYSDFVAYPIRLQIDAGERTEPLNSRQAIWTRPAAEVGDEEYAEFYKHVSHDWNEPLERVSVHIEGNYEARALLFLPSQAPLDLYHADSAQRGVQLYVKRVFIMDDCREMLPEWLRFVRGVVDAEDAALNVSRELLQNDRQVRAIRKRLVKKLLDSLERMLREEREKYARFWAEFGPVLKEALYSLEPERERVLKLLLCETSESAGGLTTLAEYVERMGEGQEEIHYLTGGSPEMLRRSPQLEAFRARGREVLLLSDRIDEVWPQQQPEFEGRRLAPVGQGELAPSDESQKEALEAKQSLHRDLLQRLRSLLQEEVKQVRFSTRLTDSPVCLVGDEGDLSPRLEEMLRQSGQDVPATKRILELNPDHPLIGGLQGLFEREPASETLARCARLLYAQALLIEGQTPPDPAGLAEQLGALMLDALGD